MDKSGKKVQIELWEKTKSQLGLDNKYCNKINNIYVLQFGNILVEVIVAKVSYLKRKLLFLLIAQTYNQLTTPLTNCETLRKRFSPILDTHEKRHRTKTIKRRWRWKQFRFVPFFSSFIEKEKKN